MPSTEPRPAQIRVMVADDHAVVRAGIAALAAKDPDIKVVAQASNGREAIECFRLHRPDITLMDLQMPLLDGISAIALIHAEWPSSRILVLSTYSGDAQALRAMKAGACGYLLKSAIRKDMLAAIRTVHGGGRYLSAEVAAEIGAHAVDEPLSPREVEVLRHVANSGTNKMIGERLGLAETTLKAHVKNVMEKLGAADRTQAVMIALRRGIIPLDD